jgi:HPt (histidine-containing phosphotransfer) domain-containing protein
VSTETQHSDDEFQRELVELFGQEAQEWLVQIDAALIELEAQAAPDRHVQLVEAIVRAITSLGGSAATINLPEVERVTFALLPFIDIVRDRTTANKQDYFTVRQQFSVVTAAVREATGLAFGADPPADGRATTTTTIDLFGLLTSLRDLHETCARTRSWTRHLIQNVIRRLEQEAREGQAQVDSGSFQRMLEELVGADDELFLDLQRTLPEVRRAVDSLKARPACRPLPSDDLMPSLLEVERLHGRAQHIHAAAIATFLAGLRNFMTLLAQRRIGVGSSRLEAVVARIGSVLDMTPAWVQSGREEREAIMKVLPDAT